MLKSFVPALLFAAVLSATPAWANVTCVQQGLVDLGFDPGPVDGALGKKTVTAASLFAANAGLTIEPLTKNNSDAWCTAITDFAKTPEAATISRLDLVSEPDGILSERDTQRLWNAYKTAKECMAGPTYGEGYAYKLPLRDPEAFAAEPWTSPFTPVKGAPECSVPAPALQTPKPMSVIVLDESDGERVETVDRAATWFRKTTNYYRYTRDPAAFTLLRDALLDWAENDGLGKGIRVSWGQKPVDYQMMSTILAFTATVAEIAPELTADDRAVIGPWLQDLLKQVAASQWGQRQDNKQFMRTYTTMLWGLIIGDDRPVQEAIFTFKRAIHDMRPDGSWPFDSQRGGMGLSYNSAAASHIVMIATALKRARNIDLFSYEVEGRSVHTTVDWVVRTMQDPVGANRQYAIPCPDSGDRFGSIDNPNMYYRDVAGYLLAYAELFPERASSQFIVDYFKNLSTPDEEKNAGTPSCQFTLNSGQVSLPPLVLPEPVPGLLEPTIVVRTREEISNKGGELPDFVADHWRYRRREARRGHRTVQHPRWLL